MAGVVVELVRFLQDGLSFGGQPVHVIPDKGLCVSLALDEELTADPSELVRPAFRHLQGKLLHLLAVNQHASSSSALYLSWDRTHSWTSTSLRTPRNTGWYRALLSLNA